jgi:hypothetical protein
MLSSYVVGNSVFAKLSVMTRLVLLIIAVSLSAACGVSDTANTSDRPVVNSAGNSNIGGLPPDMTPRLIEIQEVQPPQVVTMDKGDPKAKKTPGIPGPDELKKPFKPGPDPTPGIPDEKTIKRMLSRPASNANVNRP